MLDDDDDDAKTRGGDWLQFSGLAMHHNVLRRVMGKGQDASEAKAPSILFLRVGYRTASLQSNIRTINTSPFAVVTRIPLGSSQGLLDKHLKEGIGNLGRAMGLWQMILQKKVYQRI